MENDKRNCKCGCGETFIPTKSWQLFISGRHRDRWHINIRRKALKAYAKTHYGIHQHTESRV